jgi:hypothetical protein
VNRRQKAILIDSVVVITITAIAVLAMVNLKDWVNRSEAMRAMEQLGQEVLNYRNKYGSVPPQSYLDSIRENLQGNVRLGNLRYRARWIDFDCPPDEILAYTEKNYRSLFLSSGSIVLRLDGKVEWMDKQNFEALLARQRSPLEIQTMKEY